MMAIRYVFCSVVILALGAFFASGCSGNDAGEAFHFDTGDAARAPLPGMGVFIVQNLTERRDAGEDGKKGAPYFFRVWIDGQDRGKINPSDGKVSWKAYDLEPGPHQIQITVPQRVVEEEGHLNDSNVIFSEELIAVDGRMERWALGRFSRRDIHIDDAPPYE